MSVRTWLFVVAVGLVAALPVVAQNPECKGASCPTPSEEEDSDKKAEGDENNQSGFAIPFRLESSPDDAERAKESEQETRKHDAADLVAQQRAATAAEESARASKWQVWLGAAGAIGLIASLIFSALGVRYAAKGNANTIKAINQEQANAQRQIRAYVGISTAGVYGVEADGLPIFHIELKNFGATPAKSLRLIYQIGLINGDVERFRIRFPKPTNLARADLGPGAITNVKQSLPYPISAEEVRLIGSGHKRFVIGIVLCFTDVFGRKHKVVIRMQSADRHDQDGTYSLTQSIKNNRAT
jgi:hypothetical protein